MPSKHKVQLSRIIADEDGVGGGVVDSLGCKGFKNNSKPSNKAYYNLKSECGFRLAEMAGEIWINVGLTQREKESINQELACLKTYQTDKDGKLRIMPKGKIKDVIGRSTDWLDCFIMRMFYVESNYERYVIR